jgi:carbonic anhydrase
MSSALIEGYKKFVGHKLDEFKANFKEFENGQSPKTLFITCSDSRIDPHLITNSVPGELFVIRNAGNSIRNREGANADQSVISTLEYAINILKIKDVVVCGHSDCGAIKATQQDLSSTNYLKDYIPMLKTDGDFNLDDAIEKNVLNQINHIKEFNQLDLEGVNFYGWVYSVSTGDLKVYDGNKNSFQSV